MILEIGVLPVGPKVFGTWTGALTVFRGAMDGKDGETVGIHRKSSDLSISSS